MTIQLKRAVYKGVPFLFEDATTTGGNRLIKFNYPGSDRQAIERQGKAPRSFALRIWIQNDNYDDQKAALMRVFEDGKFGTLTHPYFGDVQNIINGTYTLTEKISELGRALITVTFEVNDTAGVPVLSGKLDTVVQSMSEAFNSLAESDLADEYNVSNGSFLDAVANVTGTADAFEAVGTFAADSAEKVASYTKKINTLRTDVSSLVRAPATMASSLSDLFQSLDNLYGTPEQTLKAMEGLFNFGYDDPQTPQTTSSRIERLGNRDAIRAFMRGQALSYAYANAVYSEYETTEQLDEAQGSLEAQYTDLRENQDISNEALEALDQLRVTAHDALNAKAVDVREIIEIETQEKPLSVLVYQYYGSTELVGTISKLNNVKQNAFVSGTVRMLSE